MRLPWTKKFGPLTVGYSSFAYVGGIQYQYCLCLDVGKRQWRFTQTRYEKN